MVKQIKNEIIGNVSSTPILENIIDNIVGEINSVEVTSINFKQYTVDTRSLPAIINGKIMFVLYDKPLSILVSEDNFRTFSLREEIIGSYYGDQILALANGRIIFYGGKSIDPTLYPDGAFVYSDDCCDTLETKFITSGEIRYMGTAFNNRLLAYVYNSYFYSDDFGETFTVIPHIEINAPDSLQKFKDMLIVRTRATPDYMNNDKIYYSTDNGETFNNLPEDQTEGIKGFICTDKYIFAFKKIENNKYDYDVLRGTDITNLQKINTLNDTGKIESIDYKNGVLFFYYLDYASGHAEIIVLKCSVDNGLSFSNEDKFLLEGLDTFLFFNNMKFADTNMYVLTGNKARSEIYFSHDGINFSDTLAYSNKRNKNKFNNENKIFTIENNQLLLQNVWKNNNKIFNAIAENIIAKYKNGRQTISLTTVLTQSDKRYKVGDIVIPYGFNDKPIARKKNGEPKQFCVTSAELKYNGAFRQNLEMVEVT